MLTEQRRLFVEKFFIHFNGERAAIESGYSEKTARVQASQMLADPETQEYLQSLRERQKKRLDLSADRALEEVHNLSYYNVLDYYREDGTFKSLNELTREQASAIESIETEKDGEGNIRIAKIKFHGKDNPLEKVFKYLGLYKVDNAQQANVVITTKEHKRTVKSYVADKPKAAEQPGEGI